MVKELINFLKESNFNYLEIKLNEDTTRTIDIKTNSETTIKKHLKEYINKNYKIEKKTIKRGF
jgi:hypothetical protein